MRLNKIWHFSRTTFILVDYVLLWSAVVCAFKLSPRYLNDILLGPWLNSEIRIVGYGMPLLMVLGLQVTSIQRSRASFRVTEVVAQSAAGLAGGMLVFLTIHALTDFSLVGRFVLLFSFLYGMVFIVGSRLVIWKMAGHQRRHILVYGGPKSVSVVELEVAQADLPVGIVGYPRFAVQNFQDGTTANSSLTLPDLHAHCVKLGAEEIVLEVIDELSAEERAELLRCTQKGIRVSELGYFYEREFERVYVPGLKEAWFWSYDIAQAHPIFYLVKRGMDILISVVGLVLFLPFAPLVYFVIKAQDGGPAIYTQVRVGLYHKPFEILKFRTMRVDAEARGAKWAQKNDSRTTLFGRFLRKTRIDEVPQFLNILRGEMSFVGPRPERPEFVELIERDVPYYGYRHLIKPGLTGWAQVNFPYGASIEDSRQKLAYDLYYMKYGSIVRDLHIILRTSVAMVRGAR